MPCAAVVQPAGASNFTFHFLGAAKLRRRASDCQTHRAVVGQKRTIDPKARIVDNRVTMDQSVGAIKATLGGYF